MKNVLVVDGALNCAYDLFGLSDDDFSVLFPQLGQNVQFAEDVSKDPVSTAVVRKMWENPIKKKDVVGIHGILFFGLEEKKEFYPSRKDSDLDGVGRRHMLGD